MFKLIGKRATGKTTQLVQQAQATNAIVVVPNQYMCKELNGTSVTTITYSEYINHLKKHCCNGYSKLSDGYMIDEIDAFLDYIGVRGYTATVSEEVI